MEKCGTDGQSWHARVNMGAWAVSYLYSIKYAMPCQATTLNRLCACCATHRRAVFFDGVMTRGPRWRLIEASRGHARMTRLAQRQNLSTSLHQHQEKCIHKRWCVTIFNQKMPLAHAQCMLYAI